MRSMKWLALIIGALILGGVSVSVLNHKPNTAFNSSSSKSSIISPPQPTTPGSTFPLAISEMRQKSYPGSDLVIEQTLSPGANYNRYVVSYMSDGLKIYGLLTVPTGTKPQTGWPVILLNHGYIPPAQYSTIDSYAIMVDPLASAGFIVFKPDYRGNGNSQGSPTQIYVSPDYVSDSLNALASVKKFKDANPEKIGVLGHSMGGNITLHELVIEPNEFQAAELLSGVVGSYSGILDWWHNRGPVVGNDAQTKVLVDQFISKHGTPESNPTFWNSIDPTHYLSDIVSPVQIQVGTSDNEVPPQFSQNLQQNLKQAGKNVSFYEYPGADHNLAPDTSLVMQRTVEFFNRYLK